MLPIPGISTTPCLRSRTQTPRTQVPRPHRLSVVGTTLRTTPPKHRKLFFVLQRQSTRVFRNTSMPGSYKAKFIGHVEPHFFLPPTMTGGHFVEHFIQQKLRKPEPKNAIVNIVVLVHSKHISVFSIKAVGAHTSFISVKAVDASLLTPDSKFLVPFGRIPHFKGITQSYNTPFTKLRDRKPSKELRGGISGRNNLSAMESWRILDQ